MPNVGPMELVLVLVIALIVLGPKKLPEVGRSLGKGMREFKDSLSGPRTTTTSDERRGPRPRALAPSEDRARTSSTRSSSTPARDAPNECCGDGRRRATARAVACIAAENTAASPLRFEVDGLELHRTLTTIEDAGLELGAIYHSHTRSEPYPSQTDINFAANWPGVEWIIVGLASGGEPDVRSYLIDGRQSISRGAGRRVD